jgi:hypothetical protein
VNSRAKGCRGELMFRDLLREWGYEAERGQQHAGGADSQDVNHNVPGVHFEVKFVEAKSTGTVYDWLEQAQRDAGPKNMPVVVHKRSRKPWVAIVPIEHFMRMVRCDRE